MDELRWILLGSGALLLVGIYVRGLLRQRAARPAPREEWSAPSSRSWQEPPVEQPEPVPESPSSGDPWSDPVADAGPVAAAPPPTAARVPPTTPAPVVRREPTIGGARVPVVEEIELPSIATERPANRRAQSTDTGGSAARAAPAPATTPSGKPQKIITVRVTAPAPARFEGAALLSAIEGLDLVHGRFDIFHRMHPSGRPVFSIANLLEPGTFDPATMRSGAYPGVAIFAVLPGPVPGHHALDDLMATARSLADRLGGNLLDDRGAMLSVQRMAQMREEVTVFERQLTGARAG
jgi:cell division protein ZipA